MDFKDPQVQKSLIVGILLLIFGYVYFFTAFLPFLYSPRKAKINTLTSEYEKMSAELEKARQTVGNLAKLENEYDRLHEKWVAAQNLLPQEEEVADLLRKITKAGNQSGVEFSLFQPQAQIMREFVIEHPVKVVVRGQYHDLGIFLSKVANLDRIINVNGLHIKSLDNKPTDKNKVGRDHTVEIDMTMVAYTLQKGGVEADANAKEKS